MAERLVSLSPLPALPRGPLLLLLLFCSLASACRDTRQVPGVVATVDGTQITVQDLEARRAELFSARAPESAALGDDVLLAQYRYVLDGLIEELIICRYMEKSGLQARPEAVEAEEKRIRADYPDTAAFEAMLLAEGLRLDVWRRGLYRRLTSELFMHRVLRPEISISAEEVQEYYTAHSGEFTVPEQWHFLQVSGVERQDVRSALDDLLAGRDAESVRREYPVSIHDIRMGIDLLPEGIRTALAGLEPVSASTIEADGKEFTAQVMLAKFPESLLEAAEISRRVERALAEEKMRGAYAVWMAAQKAKTKIRIAPPLGGGSAGPLAPPARPEAEANATSTGTPANRLPDTPGR